MLPAPESFLVKVVGEGALEAVSYVVVSTGAQSLSEEQVKKRKSVDKHGVKSDEAYAREVLGEMEYGIPKSLPEAPGFIS